MPQRHGSNEATPRPSAPAPSTPGYRRYMEREDLPRVMRARLLAAATTVCGIAYLVWLSSALNRAHPVMSTAFFAAEVAALMLFIITSLTVWKLRYKDEAGLRPEAPTDVDVFVTVCGEPLPIVDKTLRAVADIESNCDVNVYVLDDGGSDDIRSLAEGFGYHYLSRPGEGLEREDGKAGNLNFGIARSSGEFILVLDADQVAHPKILTSMLGYLRFGNVAFVQSQQAFVVPEADPFFSQDPIFYEVIQLANDEYNSAISCGSGVIYRREALLDIGGFATWNLVEDLTTSYELHSRGWKSFYFSHPLSSGLAPSTIWAVYQQRGQWALDTLRMFFWDNPLLKKGLSWNQRQQYLVIGFSYLCSAVVFPFFFWTPIWTYLTGGTVLNGVELDFLFYRGIYFVAMAVAWRSLYRKRPVGRQFQVLVGLFPVYLRAALRALTYPPGRKPGYRVNNLETRTRPRPAAIAVAPQLAFVLANATLPIYAVVFGTAETTVIFLNLFVSALAIWSLLPVVAAALTMKEIGEQPTTDRAAPAEQTTGGTPATELS